MTPRPPSGPEIDPSATFFGEPNDLDDPGVISRRRTTSTAATSSWASTANAFASPGANEDGTATSTVPPTRASSATASTSTAPRLPGRE